MIPPIVRRCPRCGHVGLTGRFEQVDDEERRLVQCPSCGYQFETRDDPWLAALGLRS